MYIEDHKYEGVLHDLNLEKCDDLLLKELLKRNIYSFENNNNPIFLTTEEHFEIQTYFYYKSARYILNPEIKEEIYEVMKSYVTSVMSDYNVNSNKLNNYLESFLEKEDKIKKLLCFSSRSFESLE